MKKISQFFRAPRPAGTILIIGVFAGITIGGGVGVVASPSSKPVTVCVNQANFMRYSKTNKCAAGETRVAIGQAGAAGAKVATAAIVARHDAGSVSKTAYAAGVADDYVVNGKSDWWLPSIDELELISENVVSKGLGRWYGSYYYSSSEYSDTSVWAHRVSTGISDTTRSKSTSGYVRPVRAF
jgi:hypothetical protein